MAAFVNRDLICRGLRVLKLNGFCFKQLLYQQACLFTSDLKDCDSNGDNSNKLVISDVDDDKINTERVYKILEKLKKIEPDDDNYIHWTKLKSKLNSSQSSDNSDYDSYELNDMLDADWDVLEMDNKDEGDS